MSSDEDPRLVPHSGGEGTSALPTDDEFVESLDPGPGVPWSSEANRLLYGGQAWPFPPEDFIPIIEIPWQPRHRRQFSNSLVLVSDEIPKSGLWPHCSEYGFYMRDDNRRPRRSRK